MEVAEIDWLLISTHFLRPQQTRPLVLGIIQFLKVMYLVLPLQVPTTLSSVFSKTDKVFLKEDNNTSPRACISQYNTIGVYWLVQALWYVLCNTHSLASAQRMY